MVYDGRAFMHVPAAHWRHSYSTNPLERLNREIGRRDDVVGRAARLRLLGAVLMEQQDEWAAARRYVRQEAMVPLWGRPPAAWPGGRCSDDTIRPLRDACDADAGGCPAEPAGRLRTHLGRGRTVGRVPERRAAPNARPLRGLLPGDRFGRPVLDGATPPLRPAAGPDPATRPDGPRRGSGDPPPGE